MNLTHLFGNFKDEFLDAFGDPFLRPGQARYEFVDGELTTAVGAISLTLGVTSEEFGASTPEDGIGGLGVIVPAVSRLQQSFGA